MTASSPSLKSEQVPGAAIEFFELVLGNCEISDEILSPFVTTPCWIWKGAVSSSGYGRVGRIYAHRASYAHFRGQLNDEFACHHCDQRQCVNPSHLFLGDAYDNAHDAVRKGRLRHGEGTANHKLTEGSVLEMRRRYMSEHITTYDLAKAYGVGSVTASKAIRGESWGHLKFGSIECRRIMKERQVTVSGRFSKKQIQAICRRHESGESTASLAESLECHGETIRRAYKRGALLAMSLKPQTSVEVSPNHKGVAANELAPTAMAPLRYPCLADNFGAGDAAYCDEVRCVRHTDSMGDDFASREWS